MLSVLPTNFIELKILCLISFSFTLAYELREISKGGRDIFKLDHFTFVFGYALIIFSFLHENVLILPIATILMAFTLGYEIYRVRKLDLQRFGKNN